MFKKKLDALYSQQTKVLALEQIRYAFQIVRLQFAGNNFQL
jgi:hypothetical protein